MHSSLELQGHLSANGKGESVSLLSLVTTQFIDTSKFGAWLRSLEIHSDVEDVGENAFGNFVGVVVALYKAP